MNEPELISPDVAQLILLFSAQPELRFPDLDAAVLHDAVAKVKEHHRAVAAAEAALAAAEAVLERENESLLKLAQRAHAYLRVFAENDERLTELVDAISLPRVRRVVRTEPPAGDASAPAEPPRKRGRPRKDAAAANAPTLFQHEAAGLG